VPQASSESRANGQSRPPLAGVRVLDFTHVAAGPAATQLLALLGAEVIKVESSLAPDLYRTRARREPPGESDDPAHLERSHFFHAVNLNKRSICINLKHPEGVNIVRRLVPLCHLLVENFRPGVMERLGLGAEALLSLRPDLVVVSASSCGASGPDALSRGFATGFSAAGGLAWLTAHEGHGPSVLGRPVDLRVGYVVAMAALGGLLLARRTGKGVRIDLSAREVITTLVGEAVLAASVRGPDSEYCRPLGNHTVGGAPDGCYRTGDGRWVAIAAGSDERWPRLCSVLGNPDWTREDRFADAYRRWLHRDELDSLVGREVARWQAAELVARFQEAGLPATVVMTSADLCQDPHIRQRGTLRQVSHPHLGEAWVMAAPWRFAERRLPDLRPAPTLGQDTEPVLRELLGLSRQEIRRLMESGALA
jgi:benzylsuccinate CoA-transferase BbsF subunit